MNTTSYSKLLELTYAHSRYAKHILESDPKIAEWLANNYQTSVHREELISILQQNANNLLNEDELSRAIRRLRKHIMVKLILRDINGLATLNEVILSMTALAEITVQHAQRCLEQQLEAQFGTPQDEQGTPQSLLVIGMGKLGGGELNVSSDIDLIFIYPEDGQTNGKRQLSNHEYFTRMGRRLINLINELTADGYVFRVDMRLRPYGDSGPLVMSFAALEQYLITQGREWERYAWIKARLISPEISIFNAELKQVYMPFVYRKYLDFGAIESMRKLHAQIRQEVHRRDRMNNIKLGPGGIREIEFTAQVFQLIRGGQDYRLRTRATQQVLELLAEFQFIAHDTVAQLDEAYIFLRNLEHRLQYLDDAQTQELPQKPEDQQLIAQSMGFANYEQFLEKLNQYRHIVSQQFEHIFGEPETSPHYAIETVWQENCQLETLTKQLEQLAYQTPNSSAENLLNLRQSSRYQQLPEMSRLKVDKIIPQCIQLCAEQTQADETLNRVLSLIEAISRRSSYLSFLSEYPHALKQLIKIMAASSWASDYLTLHPALLDELLDAREYYQAPNWETIAQEIKQRLLPHADDVERQLDILRHIQQEQNFHLLAMDLQGHLPLEKLSDHLSDLADLLLAQVLELSWATSRKRHCDTPKFSIIAYGKLGGKELGYASDLDIIFLYEDEHPDAQEHYARLAKRINTLLSSHTASGRLYETDLRLRPNGSSGLLVSSTTAFQEYQQQQAWVWEHQALTRARFSAGDKVIGAKFQQIRNQVLCQKRDLSTLKQEVLTMRQKMHDGHPNPSDLFDVKHDQGGMVDIEFMVQYLILAYAHQYPELSNNMGNIKLLKLASELKLIPSELAEQTRNLYRVLRATQHKLRLNNISPCRVAKDQIDVTASKEMWALLFNTTD